MIRKWFKECKTKQELRKAYIQLIRKYHPDNGGDENICKEINTEYELLINKLPDVDTDTDRTKEYSDAWKARQTEAKQRSFSDCDEKIRNIIYNIVGLKDVDIEIVGLWVWLSGNTYPYRDTIKANGFTWSKARKKWYASPYDVIDRERKYYKKESFETLRNRYGSEHITDSDHLPEK